MPADHQYALHGTPVFDEERERLHLLVVYDVVTGATAVVVIVMTYVFIARTPWLPLLAVLVALAASLMAAGFRPIARGDLEGAVRRLAVANWSIALAAAAIATFAWPLMVLAALLPAVLAPPYVPRRRLGLYVAASLAVALGVATIGLLQDFSGFEDQLPTWVPPAVVIFFTPFMAWMVIETVLQNSTRLHAALSHTLAANVQLRQSEEVLAKQAESLQASRARLVAATDRERRRVERDLHDGAQQRLVAVGLRLRLTQDLCRRDPDAAIQALAALREEVHAARTELRDLAHGVYPAVLSQHGLGAALGAAADRCPIPVGVDADNVRRFDRQVEATVYFCCVEALQNAAKYAGAEARVQLTIDFDGDQLGFTVADDGVGFDTTEVPEGDGFANLRDRLGATGGRLVVDSRTGRGTTVTGTLPAVPR